MLGYQSRGGPHLPEYRSTIPALGHHNSSCKILETYSAAENRLAQIILTDTRALAMSMEYYHAINNNFDESGLRIGVGRTSGLLLALSTAGIHLVAPPIEDL